MGEQGFFWHISNTGMDFERDKTKAFIFFIYFLHNYLSLRLKSFEYFFSIYADPRSVKESIYDSVVNMSTEFRSHMIHHPFVNLAKQPSTLCIAGTPLAPILRLMLLPIHSTIGKKVWLTWMWQTQCLSNDLSSFSVKRPPFSKWFLWARSQINMVNKSHGYVYTSAVSSYSADVHILRCPCCTWPSILSSACRTSCWTLPLWPTCSN